MHMRNIQLITPNPTSECALNCATQDEDARTDFMSEGGRLTDDEVGLLVKDKLQEWMCGNQGYVLDGFPKNVAQASVMFAGKTCARTHVYAR